jgi:hypothetical protein
MDFSEKGGMDGIAYDNIANTTVLNLSTTVPVSSTSI